AKIHCPPDRLLRFAKLEHQQSPTRIRDPGHFTKTYFPVHQVAQSIANGDDVECVGGEWKKLRVTSNESRYPEPFAFSLPLCRNFQHLFREIQTGDLATCLRQS